MMPKFTNSISLPMNSRRRGKVVGHVRSASLPCQSHPLITDLQEKIADVQSWALSVDGCLESIEDGLSKIRILIWAVNDFLNISHTQTALQRAAFSAECLLDNFLHLVESYRSLLSDLLVLKQQQFETQSALRRHDSVLLVSSLKSQKRIRKDLSHLTISLRTPNKFATEDSEADTFGILKHVIGAISGASMVLFNRVVVMSAAASTAATSSALCTVRPFKKKISNGETEMSIHVKFEELEQCGEIVESGSEKVLRELMNCRVALLNIQSNSFKIESKLRAE